MIDTRHPDNTRRSRENGNRERQTGRVSPTRGGNVRRTKGARQQTTQDRFASRTADQFTASLANASNPDHQSLNPYRNVTRRQNLLQWLNSFVDSPRSVIFIGEAPGVKGARITGIPFTSPNILNSSDDPWQTFGPETLYQVPHPHDPHQREATATIFWKHVNRHFANHPRPLTWNAYPFWPHEPDKERNRHPSVSEIENGSRWLRDIIELFPNSLVVSVGNVADHALRSMGIKHEHVRHPSHGGASDFDVGLGHIRDLLR